MTRVAVVGVGSMGRNHVRVYSEMPGVELVAVVDCNLQAAQRVEQVYRARAYSDVCEMLEKERPEAVSVVVPTSEHHAVAKDMLEAGCHVLVEKPIAATVEDAEDLINTAARLDRILMVGHIERFNPAIIELKRRLDAGELGPIFQINARRLGPFPTRISDVGVVMDLVTRKRGEFIERSFAHCYDIGEMRRTHLRKHDNILKRLLIHVAGFNLSLILRQLLGLGTARGLQGLAARALGVWEGFWTGIRRSIKPAALLDAPAPQWPNYQLRAA